MSEYYNIVPWYDTQEWHEVYKKIYIDLDQQEALNVMKIWKARCPSLPSGIESTLTLLEVHMQDMKHSGDISKDQFLRLAYSSAIMRFVNHMLDSEIAKGSSLYQAASNLGVPDWIIDLRHDTAHSNNLPSIELLREASLIGLNWLQKSYWEKHKACIEDFATGRKNVVSGDENKITALMQFFTSLSICLHSKIKRLSDIPDADMRESIVNDTRELFGEEIIDLSNLKTVSIMSLVNLMNMHTKRLLKSKDTVEYVVKALLGEDTLFLSIDLVNTLSEHDFKHKNNLNPNYVKCFELLLTFLHTNDLLLDFLLELVNITEASGDKTKSYLAALWLSEILKALKKAQTFVDKMNKAQSQETTRKRKELKSLYHHWFPNEKVSGLILDLEKPVPSSLKNISFVQPIISSYNPYLTYFIADFLNLIEPHLCKGVKEKICKLANVISTPEKLNNFPSKIYTIDDLKFENQIKFVSTSSMEIDEPNSEETIAYEQAEPAHSIWKLSAKQCDWSTYPIGQQLG